MELDGRNISFSVIIIIIISFYDIHLYFLPFLYLESTVTESQQVY